MKKNIKVKLLISIDEWDKYAEINGITMHEADEIQENQNWYLQTDKYIADVLIKNKMAELTN